MAGLLIGIFVPIISSIIPISYAFNQGLNISLDMHHSKTQGVQINIEQLNKGPDWMLI